MKYFKDPQDPKALHQIEEGFEHLLLEGLVEIMQVEAEAIEAQNGPQPPAPKTLSERKADKNAEINAARLAANRSTFTHAGKAIACDELSRGDIEGTSGFVTLYGGMPPGWPGGWKAVDNTYVAIPDVTAWKAFYASMYAAGIANFTKAQTLKAQLAAATTPKQVASIVW